MNNLNQKVNSLEIEILLVNGEPIKDAKVELQFLDHKEKEYKTEYNPKTSRYMVRNLKAGNYLVKVSHGKLEGQSRKITLGVADSRELFILGMKGAKMYFREKVRVPVDADLDLIAVALRKRDEKDSKSLDELFGSLELQRVEVTDLCKNMGIILLRTKNRDIEKILERLSDQSVIEYAGALVSKRKDGFSFLTRDIVVRFNGPRVEEVSRIAKEHGFEVIRDLVYSPHTYVLRWQRQACLDILDIIDKIAQRKDVDWAEPNLYVSPELDTIIPTDFLWNGLWDRQLIGAQDAWQHLQDAGLDTFGDADILLAVWDSGVQSVAGIPTNADFQGTVSNGSSKVFTSFDFINMVANNNSPWDPHGSGVAGVAAALANNPAPVAGPSFGLVGTAPNVQIMTIAGTASTDVYVGDQYIWMAGFDPQSTVPGFPAQLSRGADVITCSLTPGAGGPLSGTAKATLDFVTTFGRGGKGTMCFFSTGNVNANNVMARPYGAYEKCFGMAATSIDDDGVTEIRAPYSGWGQIALCAPSQDAYVSSSAFHNPPTNIAPWGGAHSGAGNLISFAQTQTTLTAASAVGATILTVADVTGFTINSVIHIGAIGLNTSEPAKVTFINAGLNQLTVQGHNAITFAGALLKAHANGEVVMTGPANHKNDFGGTSSATPLCAGAAALVLSANPALTFIEARQILRDTALKLNTTNTDPIGQWLDDVGNPSVTSGNPPVRSGWYGYGRVNIAAAVEAAISYPLSRDLVLRDNLSDTGSVASSGAFWNSPDIWCRITNPGMDPSAIPANYSIAGPHLSPIRGQSNWVYVRVKNTGTTASLDAWVRISIAHFPGLEFTYPTSWQPTNGPSDPIPSPMTPGTYFIGEVKVSGLAPGADQIVNVEWPIGLIPPETVNIGMSTVIWHPCLLVEVTPHDGPIPTGNHVWDNNNLGQKNISIVNADAGSDFSVATVIGNELNISDLLILEINRGDLPKDVQLFVNLVDPKIRKALHKFNYEKIMSPLIKRSYDPQWIKMMDKRLFWKTGWHKGEPVVFLANYPKVLVPIALGNGRISPIVVGGIIGKGSKHGVFEIVLIQRQSNGQKSGSASIQITIE